MAINLCGKRRRQDAKSRLLRQRIALERVEGRGGEAGGGRGEEGGTFVGAIKNTRRTATKLETCFALRGVRG